MSHNLPIPPRSFNLMRSRNIKPGFFKNEVIASLPPYAQLLFIGLWTLADRSGRLEDRPARIQAELFPYNSKIDINQLLNLLSDVKNGFIVRYEHDSKCYLQIINFEKHQHCHVKEVSSTIPAPGLHQSSTGLARLVSDVPLTSYPLLISPSPVQAPVFDFELVWTRYPKKLGKTKAQQAFKRSVKTEQDMQKIQQALTNYLNHIKDKEAQFIQHGSTWFNNWQDWVEYRGENGNNDSKSTFSYAALARAKRAAETVREIAQPREILAGIRDMPNVQIETESGV